MNIIKENKEYFKEVGKIKFEGESSIGFTTKKDRF